MSWNHLYRLKSYLRSSLWVVPFVAIPLELALSRVLHGLDEWLGWRLLGYPASGARALLETIITATLTFSVFTFASLLVAIQVASGQMTPRIIATTLLRDGTVKYIVGLFIFTLLFSVSALGRMGNDVHQTVVFTAASLGILCFAAFLYLIDYAARLLRPVSILARIGNSGILVVGNVYPDSDIDPGRTEPPTDKLGRPSRVVYHKGSSGIILAVNVQVLTAAAQKSAGVIELLPQVGDFVATGNPLFNLYGGAQSTADNLLFGTIVFGSERTLEQDPTFAFRIAVDIALRALSQAINDPTTAVLAIDQLHRMLRHVGQRQMHTDQVVDGAGRLCVILKLPGWEDFVHLAFSEIRYYGSGNLQIVRRLRAMIENLIETLPEHRHPCLQQQLDILDREIELRFTHPEELLLARISDSQGLGGRSGAPPREIGVVKRGQKRA
jgi:uncharacterized membrane protein